MRVLIVEDDDRVVEALTPALRRSRLEVDRAATAAAAADLVDRADLVLLDMGLPDCDGLALCRRIRATSELPIIAVTARRDEPSVVAALRAGVDDYVVKPYSLPVLLARIEAVLRRTGRSSVIVTSQVADVEVDHDTREVAVAGRPVRLSVKEFDLLSMLLQARGAAVTRQALMEGVWGTSWIGASRTLDVHVSSLRAKLDRPELIASVRGIGYRIVVGGSGRADTAGE